MNIRLSPYAPENMVSRDGFSLLILHTQAESGAYSGGPSRFPPASIYLNRLTPSGHSRVDRVTQLRTDGVHYRESAGVGPANLKVVPNECCLVGKSP